MNYTEYLAEDTFAIFLFHGVVPEQRWHLRNYNRKHIDSKYFREILTELKNSGNPVSMNDIVAADKSGEKLPANTFAISFDDGFENNFSVAAPILAELEIPAVFYITTDFVETGACSWIDVIENGFEKIFDQEIKVALDGNEITAKTTKQKIDLLNEIRKFVKGSQETDPYEFAADVLEQLEINELTLDPDLDKKMNWDDVRDLQNDKLFTIGGHSQSHRSLGFLGTEELKDEINGSLDIIREHIEKDMRHYSYPEGQERDYSEECIQLLKNRGIVCSPSAIHGVNNQGEDLFHLKRISVV